MIGNVHTYNVPRRFGFIATQEGRTIFFHRNDLVLPGHEVEVSDLVSFDVARDARGVRAVRIELVVQTEPEADAA